MANTKTRPATFDLNDPVLQALIAQAVEARLAASKPEPKSDAGKIDYDQLCIKAFKKAGYSDVQPRINVKTYNLWLADGFKVKPGETAVRVKQLRLFHISQVVKLNPVEAKKAKAELAAKAAARTADKLPAVSPIAAPVATSPKPAKAKRRTVPITQPTTAA
jgi:hypothetical protein